MEKWLNDHWSYAQVVQALSRPPYNFQTSDRSVSRAVKRWGLAAPPADKIERPERPGYKRKDDKAEITSPVSTATKTPEQMMLDHNLDPEEWEVVHLTINEWEGPPASLDQQVAAEHEYESVDNRKYTQIKIHLRQVKPLHLVLPARIDGPRYTSGHSLGVSAARFVVLTGDQQAPHHHPHFHQLFCEWLHENHPDEGVLMGDTIDLPSVSRHPKNPEWHPKAQECVDAGYLVLADYRNASEPTRWKKLIGNHDERLRRSVIDVLEAELYSFRRALVPGQEPDLPLLDVGHILRLDELDIELIRPNGDYEHTQINLSPHLAARHGWIARKGSGASALATLEHLGFSVVVGHTHRQSLVHKTRHDINNTLTTLAACETGCMCRIEEGLGYAVAPDWQNGFATANIWPDGTFKIDVATYVDGRLYWRDQRYV